MLLDSLYVPVKTADGKILTQKKYRNNDSLILQQLQRANLNISIFMFVWKEMPWACFSAPKSGTSVLVVDRYRKHGNDYLQVGIE